MEDVFSKWVQEHIVFSPGYETRSSGEIKTVSSL